jgi:predicted TPR repeat methyltransferase
MFGKIKVINYHNIKSYLSNLPLKLMQKIGGVQRLIQEAKHKCSNLAQTNYELGIFHLKKNHFYDAKLRFRIALFFNKNYAEAYYQWGYCLALEGKKDLSVKYLKQALALKPHFAEAEYIMAVLIDHVTPTSIPLSIIQDYFDDFSKIEHSYLDYHASLTHSHFVSELLENISPDTAVDILDIGCGDGAVGQMLQSKLKIRTLTGIDISAGMLSQARSKNSFERPSYDLLSAEDYCEYLGKNQQKYNLIVASLSLPYNASLTNNLQLCAYNLTSDGILVFSVEESLADDVALAKDKKSFCYSKRYIDGEVASAKLKIKTMKSVVIDDELSVLIYICSQL